MKNNKLQKFCNSVFFYIALIFTLIVLLFNFLYSANISYDTYEHITVTNTVFRGILFCFFAILFVFLLSFALKIIQRIDEKKLFWCFSLFYIIAGAYLIFNVDMSLRSDALSVYNSAKNFASGSYDYFAQGKYLHSYPHQTGLMLYDYLLYTFGKSTAFVFTVNLILVIAINYGNYKIANLVFESKLTNILTITLSFVFFPQLFFILFAYGLIPGLFFMIFAFYYALEFVKKNSMKSLLLMLLFLSFAVIIRKNYIIGAIAVIIYISIASKARIWVRLVAIFCVVLCSIMPMKLIISYFENVSGQNLDNGVPSVMWIAMGTDMNNKDRAPGWYNGFNYYTYIDVGYDSKAAAEIGKEKLNANIETIKNEPKAALVFFKEKTVSMWCENTYQSIWSGPLEVCGQYTHTNILRSLYNGEEAERDVARFCEFITQIIWMFALGFLVFYRKKYDGWQLMFLFFVGGLLFHTVWEGKSQYIYPYIYCLIPFVSYAMSESVLFVKTRLPIDIFSHTIR